MDACLCVCVCFVYAYVCVCVSLFVHTHENLSNLFWLCCLLSPLYRMSRPRTQSAHRDIKVGLWQTGRGANEKSTLTATASLLDTATQKTGLWVDQFRGRPLQPSKLLKTLQGFIDENKALTQILLYMETLPMVHHWRLLCRARKKASSWQLQMLW